ncbi:MAG: PD40 domain-containing protein [Akkermansiaceae bacterium]|nr:PD40 domain-containing protein [Armatimonadota bacterium]
MRFAFAGIVCASLSLFFVAGCGGSSDTVTGGGPAEARIVYIASYLPPRDAKGEFVSRPFTRMYTVTPDGGGRRLLPSKAESYDASPSVSPDGSRIVFLTDREECDGGCQMSGTRPWTPLQIWIMNSDGSQPRRLTDLGGDSNIERPVFSLDGSRILFTNAGALWSIGAEGGEPVRVLQGPAYQDASLSPDGSKILYGDPDSANFAYNRIPSINIMNVDGSGFRRLAGNAYHPSFSPDGSRIVYIGYDRDPFGENSSNNVWVINADGTGKTRLTDHPSYNRSPSFSPDGTKIVFHRGGRSAGDLVVMNADGSDQRSAPITPEPFANINEVNVTLATTAWALAPTK